MKKILIVGILSALLPFISKGQITPNPPGHTPIATTSYNWRGGIFAALHVPMGCDTSTALKSYQWHGSGAVYVDTCAHKFYFRSGNAWRQAGSGGGGGVLDSVYVGGGSDSLLIAKYTSGFRDTLGDVKHGLTGSDTTLIVEKVKTATVDNIDSLFASTLYLNGIEHMFTRGFYTVGDGGNAHYRWLPSSSVASDTAFYVKPTAVSGNGRWQLVVEFQTVNALQIGFKHDNTFDNRVKFKKYLSSTYPKFYIPGSQEDDYAHDGVNYYKFSDSIGIGRRVEIYGDGRYKSPLSFPNSAGLWLKPSVSTGSFIHDIEIIGISSGNGATGYNSASKHGIYMQSRAILEANYITSFDGDGIFINANNAFGENSNNSIVRNNELFWNGRNGLTLKGPDANNIDVSLNDATINKRWGFQDSSFLGNTWIANHAATNSMIESGGFTVVRHDGDSIFVCIQNHINVEPNVTAGWQNYWYFWFVSPGADNWSSAINYFTGGGYAMGGNEGLNQSGFAGGCYREGDQPVNTNYGNIIAGGFLANYGQFQNAIGSRQGIMTTRHFQSYDEGAGVGIYLRPKSDANSDGFFGFRDDLHSTSYIGFDYDTTLRAMKISAGNPFYTTGMLLSAVSPASTIGRSTITTLGAFLLQKGLWTYTQSFGWRNLSTYDSSTAPTGAEWTNNDFLLYNGPDTTILGYKKIAGVWQIIKTGNVTAGGGEINTASNLGGGLANFSTKVGVDLQFNSFKALDFDLTSNVIGIDYVNGQLFGSSQNGFVPASGGGTTNFLRADGSWASPGAGAFINNQYASAQTADWWITGKVRNEDEAFFGASGLVSNGFDKTYLGGFGVAIEGRIFQKTNDNYLNYTSGATNVGYTGSPSAQLDLHNKTGGASMMILRKADAGAVVDFQDTKITTTIPLAVNASTFVGVEKLRVAGASQMDNYLQMEEIAAPSTPASGQGRWYVNSSDSKPHFVADGGTDYDLTGTGSINIYNSDGTITGNRTVNANRKTFLFDTAAYTQFSAGLGSNISFIAMDSTQSFIQTNHPNLRNIISTGSLSGLAVSTVSGYNTSSTKGTTILSYADSLLFATTSLGDNTIDFSKPHIKLTKDSLLIKSLSTDNAATQVLAKDASTGKSVWRDVSSIGGGATPNLQAVTDVGSVTTNAITAPAIADAGNLFVLSVIASQGALSLSGGTGADVIRAQASSTGASNRLPNTGNVADTLATLWDIRTTRLGETNFTDNGNVGAGVDNLTTSSIPAGKLAHDGDYIEFTMTFVFASNANSKQVQVIYGGTTIYASGAQNQNAGSMEVEGKIVRTSATTQRITFHETNNTTLFADYQDYKTASETLSGAVTLKATGEAVSNDDIVQKLLIWKYVPSLQMPPP